ncbi:hypothetical protein SAY87_024913 [Trapa incisa]|uniref:RING-type E3 ubiquitin transferase n=1 Tax=Trapa incisa TaxID=236973 RepID=A0AAN7JG50_9MYRT|nr:hypothetical protein SAY87_024913 [Trapa incisa]
MSIQTPPPSTWALFQDFGTNGFHPRRLLFLNPNLHISPELSPPPSTSHSGSSSSYRTGNNTFDSNVIMVLSVLLCALIGSLALNSIIRCALRCSNSMASEPSSSWRPPVRLAKTSVKRKALKTFPVIGYSSDLNLPGLSTECVICLSEFSPGDRLRLLPICHHGFHVQCIDKWLRSHSSCPTCRHCLIKTCEKIAGCSRQPEVTLQLDLPVVQIVIAPLQAEAPTRDYQGST